MDIDKYDEYASGYAREQITVDTKIKSNNKGFAMLANLGWSEGQPLGLSGDGASCVSQARLCPLTLRPAQVASSRCRSMSSTT
jgi:hypothetical protein